MSVSIDSNVSLLTGSSTSVVHRTAAVGAGGVVGDHVEVGGEVVGLAVRSVNVKRVSCTLQDAAVNSVGVAVKSSVNFTCTWPASTAGAASLSPFLAVFGRDMAVVGWGDVQGEVE